MLDEIRAQLCKCGVNEQRKVDVKSWARHHTTYRDDRHLHEEPHFRPKSYILDRGAPLEWSTTHSHLLHIVGTMKSQQHITNILKAKLQPYMQTAHQFLGAHHMYHLFLGLGDHPICHQRSKSAMWVHNVRPSWWAPPMNFGCTQRQHGMTFCIYSMPWHVSCYLCLRWVNWTPSMSSSLLISHIISNLPYKLHLHSSCLSLCCSFYKQQCKYPSVLKFYAFCVHDKRFKIL